MRAWIIKRTGKTWFGNMVFETKFTFSDNTEGYAGFIFFRKKDAKKYLETLDYPDFFEVIGVTIDKSKEDNRKK